METIIPTVIHNNPEFLPRVERVTKWLEMKLGDFSPEVKAEWRQIENQKGHPVLELTLSDWSGKVQERFSPADLDNNDHVQNRLSWLWGDLLQVRNKEQVKQLKKL